MIGKSDGKQEFFSSNYTFCHDFTEEYNDVISNWTIYDKYILRSFAEKEDKQTFFDDKSILEPSDDAATIKCGPSWRTPTDEEWSELWTLCDWQWTSINGKPGYLVTGTNGNSIFLPVTGYCSGKSQDKAEFLSLNLDSRKLQDKNTTQNGCSRKDNDEWDFFKGHISIIGKDSVPNLSCASSHFYRLGVSYLS